ncbi:MAG: hypothetical protein KDK70_19155 [Myxococcales bacterium]|nr:hypothetical protein [Myxococcales bacterium]
MTIGGPRGVASTAVLLWASAGCHRTEASPEPPPPEVAACEAHLLRAVEHARRLEGAAASRVYVHGTGAGCRAAARRVARERRVELWPTGVRPRCPGPACGPPDGNPLVMIHHQEGDCFQVTELRWTGGFSTTVCDSTTRTDWTQDVVIY